ncbi:MAG TPA: hypothetical protein VHN36_10460, partial [Ilumatobacteraceae bacterium]|nr:hypothetical protein [Ilumatobacteraceae bacterium]
MSILETLARRNLVWTVATRDSNGFSMPKAAVCRALPSRITATPADRSPRSTVAAAITASKAGALNAAGFAGVVVVVVVAGIVVTIGGVVVVLVDVVEVRGAAELADVDSVGEVKIEIEVVL